MRHMPKPKPEIVPARAGHIPAIAAAVREADRAELWTAARRSPGEVLAKSLEQSERAWTGLIDAVPVCMFGVMPGGIVWMIGTHHLNRYMVLFLRRCQGCVETMQTMHPTLTAYVSRDNTVSAKWLEWLGFKITGESPMGADGGMFYAMVKRSHNE